MSGCPPRVKLLTLVSEGKDVPHLQECEDCREFVAAAAVAVGAFNDLGEVEAATRQLVDSLLAEMPPHRWTASFLREYNLCHSVVVRDLLRRADEQYGSNPRQAVTLTSTALSICDLMCARGNPPSLELRFEALKAHSSLLRDTGSLDESLSVLGRAWLIADQMETREVHRAIVSLCTSILYTEPDLARFDDAIRLAESAGAVLEVSGDRRRAVIARHTKAYALTVMNRFEMAVPILECVIADLSAAGCAARDAALAHALLAVGLVSLGSYGDALDQARAAEHLHTDSGDVVDAARAAHVAAVALAGMGHFADVQEEFQRTAEIVFGAGLFDVWCVLRLDYVAAALAHDPGADVRADIEAVARVSMTVATSNSTQRRQFAAEALDYLRRLAVRDMVTADAVCGVRSFIARNAQQRPVRFSPPPGASFLM